MASVSFVIKSVANSSGAVASNMLIFIIAGPESGKRQVLKCTDNRRAPSQALVGSNNQCLIYTNQFTNSRVSRSG